MSLTNQQIKKFGLPRQAKKYLRITDEQDGLLCLHYIDDAGKMWRRKNKKPFPFTAFRGVVVDPDSNEIIARSFGETPTVVLNSNEVGNIPNNEFYSNRLEGTIIRLSFYDKWYVTTHRRIDTSNSRFSSNLTFRQMFDEALARMNISLDEFRPDTCYVFILVHPENQIANTEDVVPTLVHLDSLVESNNGLYGLSDLTSVYEQSECPVPKPVKLDYESAVNSLARGEGVVSWGNPKVNYLSEDLAAAYDIRGNEPNLFKRWVELETEGRGDDLLSVVHKRYEDEVKSFPQQLEDQFPYATEVAFSAAQHVMYPEAEEFYPLSNRGYPQTHIEFAQYLIGSKGAMPTKQEIEQELRNLSGAELYKIVVSDTNRFIRTEEFYNSKR